MMNRTWKSAFSVLLAVALLLPMAPVVRAEDKGGEDVIIAGATANYASPGDAPTSIALSSAGGDTLYYRDGKPAGKEITVTATVQPAGYEGSIEWELDQGGLLDGVPETSNIQNDTATITLKAAGSKAGKVTLKAKSGDTSSDGVTIQVVEDTLKTTTGFSLSIASSEIQAGQTTTVNLDKRPQYNSGDYATVTYASSNTAVATVDSNTLKVTGVKAGEADISAKVGNDTLATAKIKVTPAPSALTGSATLGVNLSMQKIYNDLLADFSAAYGKPSDSAKIYFTSLIANTFYTKGGDEIKRHSSASNNPYNFSDLQEMYFNSSSEGSFKSIVTVTDGGNAMDATITITVSVPDYPILIPIDGSANYSFGRTSADANGKTGAQLIRDSIGAFGSIKFDTPNSNIGTLYTGNPPSNDNRVLSGTLVPSSMVDELYFTPSRAGTYTITFTAYSASNGTGKICTGSLLLSVDGSSLDISFSLNKVAPYTFKDVPSSGADSLRNQLINTINGAVGGTSWRGIRFDGASNASSTGVLRQNSSIDRAITANDYVSKDNISNLYYVPERAGTYEITYGVYSNDDSSARALATGKLTITTSAIPAGSPDITYTTAVKSSVTLRESDFVNFFQKVNGSKYYLSYVVFEEYEGNGTFYHNANSFLPYNSADFYTDTYTGNLPTSARYLNRLSFTAPSTAGYTVVLFTCYGGTATNSTTTTTKGKLCIYYTADDVPSVSYNVFSVASVDLKEADFVTVYNTATKTSPSKPLFTIQLLNTPGKGTLYHYYSGNNRRELTSSNIASSSFSVNGASDYSINELTYVPNRNVSGTDEITYLATSSSGAILYIGTIQFKLSSDLTLYVTNDGSNFQLSDFYKATDSDPVLYVTFPQPSTGRVYVHSGDRYIAPPTDTKFYTISTLDGQYPLTSAFYAPKANETGSVSIKYSAYHKSGARSDNIITFNVLSKNSSGTFRDVGDVTGWAANSIDFASKMGLVNGTQLNPPLFSPSNTMRRSDFVLMLYRLAGSPAVSGSVPYTDVTLGKYYYDSAVWAYRNNIMRNVTVNGLYDPEGALTRQDFAQILFNYTAAMGESTANSGSIASYVDASSVSSYTLEGVTWAVAKGYITSAVAGQLYIEPTRSATRAEISTLLHRYLTY